MAKWRAACTRATGFSCKTTKLFYDQKHNKVIEHEIEEYYPPHVGAIIMWLTNRQRDLWKSRVDQTLAGPTVGAGTTDAGSGRLSGQGFGWIRKGRMIPGSQKPPV